MVDLTNCLVCQQKKDGSLSHRTVLEEITSTYDDLGMRCERDAFDTLFDHAPDKLQVVKKVRLSYTHSSFKGITLNWAVGYINATEYCKCSLTQCFSTTGPWHQLHRAARGSPEICHFSFLSIFHE